MLPGYVEVPAGRSSIRLTWLATGATTAVVVMAAGVGWVLWADHHKPAPSPEAGYLTALESAGLSKEFPSEANAVAHGHDVCRRLEDGGPQQGLAADKIAVDAFCPRFNQGFRILESATVSGIFVLTDTAGMQAIAVDGPSCGGANGYADVGPSTPVTVKNGKGELLATTALGVGKGDSTTCTFSFTFPVTEGEDRYVVSVGRRGEFAYSFEQLRSHGVQVRLGH